MTQIAGGWRRGGAYVTGCLSGWQEVQIERALRICFSDAPNASSRSGSIAVVTSIIAHRGASAAAPENTIAAFATRRRARGRRRRARRAPHAPTTGSSCTTMRASPTAASIRATPRRRTARPHPEPRRRARRLRRDVRQHRDQERSRRSRLRPDRVGRPSRVRGARPAGRRVAVADLVVPLRDRRRLPGVLPSVRTAWLVETRSTPTSSPRTAAAGHAAVHPWDPIVDEPLIRRAHAAGLAVNTWTCDDPDRMRQLIGWGIDGICTNVPDVGVAVRNRPRQAADAGNTSRTAFGHEVELEPLDVAEVVAVELVRERRRRARRPCARRRATRPGAPTSRTPLPRKRRTEPAQDRQHAQASGTSRRRAGCRASPPATGRSAGCRGTCTGWC